MRLDAQSITDTYDATDRTGVVLSIADGRRYDRHLLTIETTGTPTGGTVTVYWRGTPDGRWFQLADEFGVARTISLATEDSLDIQGPIDAVKLNVASMATATAWRGVLRGYM